MLSTRHKAQILARAGVAVPPCPASPQHGQPAPAIGPPGDRQLQAAAEGGDAQAEWLRMVDNLYAQYAAERAAKSLRDAEAALQLTRLRQDNDR